MANTWSLSVKANQCATLSGTAGGGGEGGTEGRDEVTMVGKRGEQDLGGGVSGGWCAFWDKYMDDVLQFPSFFFALLLKH